MSVNECGHPHPAINGVVCTKPKGHEDKHGRRDYTNRSIFWDLRRTYAER